METWLECNPGSRTRPARCKHTVQRRQSVVVSPLRSRVVAVVAAAATATTTTYFAWSAAYVSAFAAGERAAYFFFSPPRESVANFSMRASRRMTSRVREAESRTTVGQSEPGMRARLTTYERTRKTRAGKSNPEEREIEAGVSSLFFVTHSRRSLEPIDECGKCEEKEEIQQESQNQKYAKGKKTKKERKRLGDRKRETKNHERALRRRSGSSTNRKR